MKGGGQVLVSTRRVKRSAAMRLGRALRTVAPVWLGAESVAPLRWLRYPFVGDLNGVWLGVVIRFELLY